MTQYRILEDEFYTAYRFEPQYKQWWHFSWHRVIPFVVGKNYHSAFPTKEKALIAIRQHKAGLPVTLYNPQLEPGERLTYHQISFQR